MLSVLHRIGTFVADQGTLRFEPQRRGEHEMPPNPNYAVTGICMYDASVFAKIKTLIPSGRGELEITDVSNAEYVFLEVHPCSGCGQMLCSCCDQFHCDGCGQIFCIDHLVSVPDGTQVPLHCRALCAAECERFGLPARMPPQSELLPPSHQEVA